MKLRNKKTGEIKEVIVGGYPVSGKTKMWECSEMDTNEETGYKSLGTYNSLAELCEEWEDAPEEPKEYWWIDSKGEVLSCIKGISEDSRRPIGNYFSSREEAEKAVKKLKAWKRLKDKGIKFGMRRHDHYGGEMFWQCPNESGISDKQIWKDLDLLFGGKK